LPDTGVQEPSVSDFLASRNRAPAAEPSVSDFLASRKQAPEAAAEPSFLDKAKKLGSDAWQSVSTPIPQTLHDMLGTGEKVQSMRDSGAAVGEAVRQGIDKLGGHGTAADLADKFPVLGLAGNLADQGMQAAGGLIDFATSPLGVATLATPALPAALQPAVGAGFGASMVPGAAESVKEAVQHPSSKGIAKAVVDTSMALLPAAHPVLDLLKNPPSKIGSSESLPSAEQAAASADANAQAVVQKITQAPPEVQQPSQSPASPTLTQPEADTSSATSPQTAVPSQLPLDGGEPSVAAFIANKERLPDDLRGAKPKYNYGRKSFDLEFESDVDKAAYIAAQKIPSRRDADYVKHVADNTGLSLEEIRARGAEIRDSIKNQAIDAKPGRLKVPKFEPAEAEEAPAAPEVQDHEAPATEDPSVEEFLRGRDETPAAEPAADVDPRKRLKTEKYSEYKDRIAALDAAESGNEPETKAEEAPAPAAAPAAAGPRMVLGGTETVKTPKGTKAEVQHAIVEAGDMVTSHDLLGNANPDYPAENQLRDRSRPASIMQARATAAKMDAREVGSAYLATTGAPIADENGAMISGNNRANALKLMHDEHPDVAAKYIEDKRADLASLGLPPDALEGFKQPAHIRILRSDVDQADFAAEANERAEAKMSAPEQAAADTLKMHPALMTQFAPDEQGNITAATNRDFVRNFIADVVPEGDRGGMITAEKKLSQEGVTRIRNAVFHAAYGDPATLEKLAETTDSNIKNITTGMLQAAPAYMKVNQGIADGDLYDIDMRPEVSEAVNKLSDLRDAGTPVERYVLQDHMPGSDISPEARTILEKLHEYRRSGDKIRRFIGNIADAVEKQGNPKQEGMFGSPELPSKGEIVDSAARATETQLKEIEDAKNAKRDAEDLFANSRGEASEGTGTRGSEARQPDDEGSPQEGSRQSGGLFEGTGDEGNDGSVQSRRGRGQLEESPSTGRTIDVPGTRATGRQAPPSGGNSASGAEPEGLASGPGSIAGGPTTPPALPDSSMPPKGGSKQGKFGSQSGSIDPELLSLGAGKFLSQDVVPKVKEAGQIIRAAVDDIKGALAPASRGESAHETAMVVRMNAADLARRTDRAEAALRVARKFFGSQSTVDNIDFMDRVEKGITQPDLNMQSIGGMMRDLFTNRRQDVQALGTGQLRLFYEHYFPHIWDDPVKAAEVMKDWYAKRNLEGSKAFLKSRAVPTIKDGLDAGLQLASANPVDLVLRKVREMDKYITAHHIMADMQDRGQMQFIRATDQMPDGWARINDKIATIFGTPDKEGALQIDGYMVAPEPAAQLINNYLSPGLREKSGLFRAYLGLANTLNQFQLGFSAFHLGFTTTDVAVSRFANGVTQLVSGKPLQGLKSMASAPVAPFTNIMQGDKILKEWYKPGTQGAEVAAAVDHMIQAGGRARMDSFYRTQVTDGMMDALRSGNIWGAAARAPLALVEQAVKPILEYVVPRQKMGVFAEMARVELDRLPAGSTALDAQTALARAWDSVDNRMGQLVYDNLFWKRTYKDVAMASIRSVGWNLGTLRELGGGASDFVKASAAVAKGKPVDWTPRMSYTVALPMLLGTIGGVANYMMTGQAPQSLDDYFFPRDGNGQRWMLPSYIKDVHAYATAPYKTITGKVHPLLTNLLEMISNKDWRGRPIMNADDPLIQQAKDEAMHWVNSFKPMAFKNAEQGDGIRDKVLPFVGITHAPKSVE
jgi:ddrB-like ParB superfamily domain